jgi:hypothetical protein
MSEQAKSPEEQRNILRHALIAGPARTLDLHKRLPRLFKKRGWPLDEDLLAVAGAAIALTCMGQIMRGSIRGLRLFRRPAAAEGCGGKWPLEAGKLTAPQIVAELELDDLLRPI